MALLKHIVFIKYSRDNNDDNKDLFLKELRNKLESLKGSIEEIVTLEVGDNISKRPTAYDLLLYVEFKSEEDLAIYSKHVEHVKVLEFMKTRKLETAVVDYLV
jgi:hypothetical protein